MLNKKNLILLSLKDPNNIFRVICSGRYYDLKMKLPMNLRLEIYVDTVNLKRLILISSVGTFYLRIND